MFGSTLDRATAPHQENYNYTEEFWPMPDTIRAKDSTEIAETIENYFLSGEVDKVEIAYSRFINLISNEPAIRTLLPLSPTGIEDPEDETFKLTTEDGKLKAWALHALLYSFLPWVCERLQGYGRSSGSIPMKSQFSPTGGEGESQGGEG